METNKEIKLRINDLLVQANRENFEYNTVLLGEKEYEELMLVCEEDSDVTGNLPDNVWQLTLQRTHIPELLELCNVMEKNGMNTK